MAKRKRKNKQEETNKKLSCYTEKSYKQGIIDGINLMLNSIEKIWN